MWDIRFLEMAKVIGDWSKDPSSKVGAVIVDSRKRIISLGFNGFARGVRDDAERYQDRDVKYELVIHAEINAILFAGGDVRGYTLYSTHHPCSRCAAVICQSGIARVVIPDTISDFEKRQAGNVELAWHQFAEAGVKLSRINLSTGVEYVE